MDNINLQEGESAPTLTSISEMVNEASIIEKNEDFSFCDDEDIAKDIKSLVSEDTINEA